MKNCFTKEDYNKMIMDLIYMYVRAEETWANVDLKKLDELIEILRFYRQFEQ